MRSLYTEYYKWKNINTAVWKKIDQIADISDRHQFLMCKLPVVLPSIPDLNLGSGQLSQKMVRIFNNSDSLMLLELWKWLGENRKDSLISNVKAKNLSKVNIVFQESGKWFVINLGRLNDWRKTPDGEDTGNNPITKGLETAQMQRRFLRTTLSLFQVRTVGTVEIPPEALVETKNNAGITKDGGVPADGIKTDSTLTDKSVIVENTNNDSASETGVDASDNIAIDETEDTSLDDKINEELQHLEAISKNHVERNFDEEADETPDSELLNTNTFIDEPSSLEDGVISVCDRLADNGLLSAAEYRRYLELSKKYRTIISPDGETTIDKYIVVTKDQLAINNKELNIKSDAVTDKSMLKSSLTNFDKKYISQVFQRDIAGMVLNMQNAGIAVTDYAVEANDDVLGTYNTYTVRITPVEGTSSTLRFKLPVVDENGNYRSNNINYKLRRQRGD